MAATKSLRANAFQLTPDPRYFFGSRSHNKAMAYLQYGVRQGEGFIVITGEVGAGKSILVSRLLDQLDRTTIVAAQIVSSNLGADDLLRAILNAFDITPPSNDKAAQIDYFKRFLLQLHKMRRRVLLIVDEAQNLPKASIEELRMLSNFCLNGKSLFQSFLVGQPQFKLLLSDPDLEQLRQRVIASYHLEPLSEDETKDYVLHRLAVAGWEGAPHFEDAVFEQIFVETGGVPRQINVLCSRLMLLASLDETTSIGAKEVGEVVADLKKEIAYNSHTDKVAATALAEAADRPAMAAQAVTQTVTQTMTPIGLAHSWAAEHMTSALARMDALTNEVGRMDKSARDDIAALRGDIARLEGKISRLLGEEDAPGAARQADSNVAELPLKKRKKDA